MRLLLALPLLALPMSGLAQSMLSLCGNPDETPGRAARFCAQALEGRLSPGERALAALNLGFARLQLGDPEGAQSAFDMAIEANPQEARAFGGRAEAEEAQGRRPRAAVDWNRAVALAPRDASLLEGRGGFRLRAGNAAGAVTDFQAALRVEPSNLRHRFNLGLALAETGRDAEAEQAFSAVISGAPDDAEAWLNRARLRAARAPQAAMADFDRAIALRPEWSLAWFERGLLKDSLGQREAADTDFRRAWELGHRSEFLTERIRTLGQRR